MQGQGVTAQGEGGMSSSPGAGQWASGNQNVQISGVGEGASIRVTFAGRSRQARQGPICAVPGLDGREVDRPELLSRLVRFVTRPDASTVGMTTGMQGAGGFGKTTLARLLVHEPVVRDHFTDGAVWVTLGQDAWGADLADRVGDVCAVLTGNKPPFSDPLLAGAELGRALGERRLLLVIDDAWSRAQLEPFLIGAPNAVRLVTTRQSSILPKAAQAVSVDAMSPSEAHALLLGRLPPPPADVLQGLLGATGRCRCCWHWCTGPPTKTSTPVPALRLRLPNCWTNCVPPVRPYLTCRTRTGELPPSTRPLRRA
jgi:NB-ARC domain